MIQSTSIRQNLLQIKNSQLQLLEQLKCEHSLLQGYVSQDNSRHQPSYEVGKALQSSLQFSKSDYRDTEVHPKMEEKYKKIEQLLLKERKMQEQSHALQKQNQSLIIDYKELKRLYNKEKEQSSWLERSYGILGQFYHSLLVEVLLGIPHQQIVQKYNDVWRKHEEQFPSIDSSWVRKSFKILSEKYKVKKQPETQKQMAKEIESLKKELSFFISAKKENQKLKMGNQLLSSDYEEKIELARKQQTEGERRLRILQTEIMGLTSENMRLKNEKIELKDTILSRENEAKRFMQSRTLHDDKLVRYESQNYMMKKSIRDKEQMIENQAELNKKQKLLIERMDRDIQVLREEVSGLKASRDKDHNVQLGKEENLKVELRRVTNDYNKYKENSQRQITSLKDYISELKKQYELLIHNEEKTKNNELKYKELISKHNSLMKFNVSVDHLWQVKEIQYSNIMKIMKNVKN